MSNYNSLKATINANIKTNGNQEITGSVLNSVLTAMVNTIGAGYSYAGVASPGGSPGTPDNKVFYLAAEAGTYNNFGGLVLSDGEVAILKWDTAWHKDTTGFATRAELAQLALKVIKLVGVGNGNSSVGASSGDYYYQPNLRQIRKATGASTWDVIPFADSLFYELNGLIWWWNGHELRPVDEWVYKDYLDPGANLFNPDAPMVLIGYYQNASGVINIGDNFLLSDYIPVKALTTYYNALDATKNFRFVCFFDENYTFISGDDTEASFTTPAGCAYARVSFHLSDITKAQVSESSVNHVVFDANGGELVRTALIQEQVTELNEYKDVFGVHSESINLLNPSDSDIQEGKYYDGSYHTSDTLDSSGLIPVRYGHTYEMFPNVLFGTNRDKTLRYVSYFNSAKTYISTEQSISSLTITNPNVAYVIISVYNRKGSSDPRMRSFSDVAFGDVDLLFKYVAFSTFKVPYVKHGGLYDEDAATLKDVESAKSCGNVLFGKKWVACGDSYTAGDFTSIADPTEYQFQDSPYGGKNKVYPFYIGRRCGMQVKNEAISGSTMAYIDGTEHEFSTANGRYKKIPADADYITLYFGINDASHGVPLGTIDDNVNTTFYGAWNIVISYLLQNHPNAKIGIIVTNDCNNADFIEAEKQIAKKYGIGWLNFADDTQMSYIYRQFLRTDIPAAIKTQYNEHWRVSANNSHPSAAMHERESVIIEDWLRRL